MERGHGKAKAVVAAASAGTDIPGAVDRVLKLIGGIGTGAESALIKPNVVFAIRPSSGIVTNPLVIEGIMKHLISNGLDPGNIVVGESGSMGFDTGKAFRKTGTTELCRRYGAKTLDFYGKDMVTKRVTIDGRDIRIDIAKAVFDADLVVNAPVIKTHFQTGISMAVKNMFGAVGFESRKTIHKYCLDEGLAHISKILPRHVTVGDATIGLQGFGPSIKGMPGKWGLVFASKDPVAHDSAICRLFGVDVPEHVKMAADIGAGVMDPASIEIIGEKQSMLSRKMKPPLGQFSPLDGVNAIDGGACAYCLYAVYLVLQRLATQGVKPKRRIDILFGRDIDESACDPKREKILCGDCTERFKEKYGNLISGCPPKKSEIIRVVRKMIGADER
ncbi:MAG: DUF362 domain-containing protein [Candidatus Aenigmarchaeota archaeon]|nr:DUF362 domain-containing protein [Candidatus Aenigmarchaeota archaeon]